MIANPVIKQVYENQGQMYENIMIPITDGKRMYNIPVNLKAAYESESKEIVKAFEKASGAGYEVSWLEAETYEREQKAKRDDGDKDALENSVWLLGAIEGNWEERDEFAMGLLGLENENLDEAVAQVVKDSQ